MPPTCLFCQSKDRTSEGWRKAVLENERPGCIEKQVERIGSPIFGADRSARGPQTFQHWSAEPHPTKARTKHALLIVPSGRIIH